MQILIDEMDAAGQGHPGLGARLEYRTARLGPSMYMPSMLSRPKHPVEPPALDACVAASPIGRELHLLFARHEFAPSSFLDPFAWSVRTRNLPLACPLCAVRERRVAGSLPEVGRRDRRDRQ